MKDPFRNSFAPFGNFEVEAPLESVMNLRRHQHTVLFYEDPIYADLIALWYLQNGLERHETCVFATYSNPKEIRELMIRRGINANYFENENLLRIYQMTNTRIDNEDTLSKNVEGILDDLFALINPKSHTRIISEPWVGPSITSELISLNMLVERNVQAAFQLQECDYCYRPLKNFNGSLICCYDLEKQKLLNHRWLRNHLMNHHRAIYAPKKGCGVAFNTQSKFVYRSS